MPKNSGIVYVMSNPSMPGILKIGRTVNHADIRSKQLDNTSVPTPFSVEIAEYFSDCRSVESELHRIFEASRIRNSREFFHTTVGEVAGALEILKTIFPKDSDEFIEQNREFIKNLGIVEYPRMSRDVYLNGEKAGLLLVSRLGRLAFRKDTSKKITISQAMRGEHEISDHACRAIFGALLPENDRQLHLFERINHLSMGNIFGLLGQVSSDSIGGLSFDMDWDETVKSEYQPMSLDVVEEFLKRTPTQPEWIYGNGSGSAISGTVPKLSGRP